MNNGLLLSQRLLTFWQPPANSILLHRSGGTMFQGRALNEALPPTVFPFNAWLGTIFLAIVLTLTLTPRRKAGKGTGGIPKASPPTFSLSLSSGRFNLSLGDGRGRRTHCDHMSVPPGPASACTLSVSSLIMLLTAH